MQLPLLSHPWSQLWMTTAVSLMIGFSCKIYHTAKFMGAMSCDSSSYTQLSEIRHSVFSPCSKIPFPNLHCTKPTWRRCGITTPYILCLKKTISLCVVMHTSHAFVNKTNRFSQDSASVYLLRLLQKTIGVQELVHPMSSGVFLTKKKMSLVSWNSSDPSSEVAWTHSLPSVFPWVLSYLLASVISFVVIVVFLCEWKTKFSNYRLLGNILKYR